MDATLGVKADLEAATSREEILNRAIALEEESRAFYEGLANHYRQECELMTVQLGLEPPEENRKAVELFRRLARAEEVHAETIRSWLGG